MAKTGKRGILKIGLSNSLFGNVKPEQLNNATSQFGWMNPDYRQVLVNNDPEAAKPKPEDFLAYRFRLLSATIVGGGSWKATDFSNEKVLRKAVPLFVNKPVYVNHELEVSNIVGIIGNVQFTPAKKDQKGQEIPAGLDADIFIDSKLHPDLCRKLSAYPVPHIQSGSVTVEYEWEPSHVFNDRDNNPDDWEFERQIGRLAPDGKMVRRIVTDIIEGHEYSFVWLGADPFAKVLDENGNPINIEKAAVVAKEQYDKDPLYELYKKTNTHFIYENCGIAQNTLSFSKDFNKNNVNQENNNNSTEMDEKLIQFLKTLFGVEEGKELTEDFVKQFSVVKTVDFNSMKEKTGKYELAISDKQKAEQSLLEATNKISIFEKIVAFDKVTELEKEIPLMEVVKFAKQGKLSRAEKVNAVIEAYKKSLKDGESADQAILNSITNSDDNLLNAYAKQFGEGTLAKFGASCKKCGSKDISFRSTEPEGGKGPEGNKLANEDFVNNYRR